MEEAEYDYVIIGSGFGGSVSALRLSEKGYKVLVIEKGKRLEAADFPKSNWNLRKWMWLPFAKCFGLFKLTFFRHVGVVSGVGVGGGSLVYANTLPIPKEAFFKTGSWSDLADWEGELKPYYAIAKQMLGATPNPHLQRGDKALQELAKQIGKEEHFEPTEVAIYFGKPDETVPDPYFGGKGPERTGCTQCGACMIGCPNGSKNTLDKNYLYLAEGLGAKIKPESLVYDVVPHGKNGEEGYTIKYKKSTKYFGKKGSIKAKSVIFAGGVLGTVKLLLKLKRNSLKNLSDQVGADVRTNSESLVGVTAYGRDKSFSEGIAIGSILHTDEHSHLEPVRYSSGNGFWRIFMTPMVKGGNVFVRIARMFGDYFRHPIKNLKVFFTDDWSKRTQILLFMQSIDTTLKFRRNWFGGMGSRKDKGKAPTAFIPEAQELAHKFSDIVDGKPMVMSTETLLGIPTTAHILGGAVMGKSKKEGVIDHNNFVFGYENMMVCDGSMISANPGVNPSLSITAISEYAMSKIPEKENK
ncbi:MAG: GMC family oxidoreductase [Aureispira sp.]|nr:GMC family oxidoreductase [Aureispira sp.]